MKRGLVLLSLCLLFASVVWAQGPVQVGSNPTVDNITFPIFTLNAVPIPGASLQVVGAPGQAIWCYWAVANFQIGSVLSPLGCVSNAANTLTSSNYVSIIPFSYPGSVLTVDILATATNQAPTGACNCAVATGLTVGGTTQQSNSLSSYTVSILNPSGFNLCVRNEVVGTASAHLLLRNCTTGALINDLSISASGTVTGSGTAGVVPTWTTSSALGNSLITSCSGAQTCSTGSTTGRVEIGSVLAPLTAGTGLAVIAQPNPSACGGANVTPLPVFGCIGQNLQLANNAGTTADVSAAFKVKALPSNFVAGTLGVGIASQVQAGFNETETRAGYFEAYENVSTTVTTRRGLFAFAANATGNTTATNEAAVFQTGTGSSSTTTNDYTVHILTPLGAIVAGGGTLTNHVGLQIEDQTQTASGGTNSNPRSISQLGNAPNAFQGHLNQIAAGNWAGTCTMSTTTCTITLTANYTSTPGCVATVQGATAIAGACSVSGATVTITAASSNTATWAAMLFGNPN
jgi:hypothetical protein